MAYQFKQRRRKYGNRKVTFDGHEFDSKREAERYRVLKSMQELGVIKGLGTQRTFVLTEPGKRSPDGKTIIPVKYVADFVYEDVETGKTVVEDVKGYRKANDSAYRIFRIKQKMMFDKFGIWIKEV